VFEQGVTSGARTRWRERERERERERKREREREKERLRDVGSTMPFEGIPAVTKDPC
jgi:hypothetical protein